jgi:hypothetical protein
MTRAAAGTLAACRVTACVVAACLVAACAAEPSGPPPAEVATGAGTPAGTAATRPGDSVFPGTPDAAALAVTAAWFRYDTRVDHRPNDTARRLAMAWLAPAMRRQVLTFTSTTDPGAEWISWTARHAWASVGARPGGDDHPADLPDAAWRQVLAKITLHGDDGWTAEVRRTVFLHLARMDGQWLVTGLQVATS